LFARRTGRCTLISPFSRWFAREAGHERDFDRRRYVRPDLSAGAGLRTVRCPDCRRLCPGGGTCFFLFFLPNARGSVALSAVAETRPRGVTGVAGGCACSRREIFSSGPYDVQRRAARRGKTLRRGIALPERDLEDRAAFGQSGVADGEGGAPDR